MISTATKERKSIREYAPRRIRAKRFQQIPQWITESRIISRAAKQTFSQLTRYADKDGTCWPSATTLGECQGITRRTVHRHLNELEAAGAIVRERRWRKTGGGQTSNLYQLAGDLPLNLPDLPAAGEICPEIMLNEPTFTDHFDQTMRDISDPLTIPSYPITKYPLPPKQKNLEPSEPVTLGEDPEPPQPLLKKSWQPNREGTRAGGTNPRAKGTNPRALGTSPRMIKSMSMRKLEAAERIQNAYKRGWNYAGLTSPPPYASAEDYRQYLETCYTHYAPEIITAETNGYHDRLNDQHQKNERHDTRYGND